jgi:predicted MPP superfamily phosphohydrolase
MNRRQFIGTGAKAIGGSMLAGGTYGLVEAKCIGVTKHTIALKNLPRAFHGKTIAFLADFHHSIVVPRIYLEHVVEVTNALAPDFLIYGGDYITCGKGRHWMHGESYIEPCFDILKKLRAKTAALGVAGNHDTWAGVKRVFAAMKNAGITPLYNEGHWIESGGERLRIAGVADIRTDKPDVDRALGDATEKDAVILVAHNPDVAEEKIHDGRVGLQLSGHTHGGQVVFPFIGAPVVGLCSSYGQKYRYGIVQGPRCPVLVTCGVGTLPIAIRINCPPEVVLITLTRQDA